MLAPVVLLARYYIMALGQGSIPREKTILAIKIIDRISLQVRSCSAVEWRLLRKLLISLGTRNLALRNLARSAEHDLGLTGVNFEYNCWLKESLSLFESMLAAGMHPSCDIQELKRQYFGRRPEGPVKLRSASRRLASLDYERQGKCSSPGNDTDAAGEQISKDDSKVDNAIAKASHDKDKIT
ncbi:hypothetical protein Tco_0425765 [Tanacetum coccineum]